MLKIRPASIADTSSIIDIYAPYILQSAASFETEVPDSETFAIRIRKNVEDWPWLVCESDGRIIGYAYASRHRERSAYQWSVESSVYLDHHFQGRGIGRVLYLALFNILKYQGCRNVYAGITLPNERSIRLHEKMGFSLIADYKNVGYKFHQWQSVRWYQKKLND